MTETKSDRPVEQIEECSPSRSSSMDKAGGDALRSIPWIDWSHRCSVLIFAARQKRQSVAFARGGHGGQGGAHAGGHRHIGHGHGGHSAVGTVAISEVNGPGHAFRGFGQHGLHRFARHGHFGHRGYLSLGFGVGNGLWAPGGTTPHPPTTPTCITSIAPTAHMTPTTDPTTVTIPRPKSTTSTTQGSGTDRDQQHTD